MKYKHLAFTIYFLHSYVCLSGCAEGDPGTVTFHLADARNPSFDLKKFQNKNDSTNEAFFLGREKNFDVFSTTVDDVSEEKRLPRVKEIVFIKDKRGGDDEYFLEKTSINSDITKPQITKRSPIPPPLPYSIQQAPLRSKITKYNPSPEPKSYLSYHSEQHPKYGHFDFDESIITRPESSYSELQAYSNQRQFYPSNFGSPLFENLGPNFYGLEKNIALSKGRFIPVSSKKISGVPYGEPLKHYDYVADEGKSKITFTDLLRINDEISPSIELSDDDKDLENILSKLANTEDSLVINKETVKKSETPNFLVQDKPPELESLQAFSNSTLIRNKFDDILKNTKPKDNFGKQLQNAVTLGTQLNKLKTKELEENAASEVTSKETVQSVESSNNFRRPVKSKVNSQRLKGRNNEDSLDSPQKSPATEVENNFNNEKHLKKMKPLEIIKEDKEIERNEAANKDEKTLIMEEEIKSLNQKTKDISSESKMKAESSEKQMASEGSFDGKFALPIVNLNNTSSLSINSGGDDELMVTATSNSTQHKPEDRNNLQATKTAKALLFSTSNVGIPLPVLSTNTAVDNSSNLPQHTQMGVSSTNISSEETFFLRKKVEVDLGDFGDAGKVNKTTATEISGQGDLNKTATVEAGTTLSPKPPNKSVFVVKSKVDSSEEEIVDLLFSPLFRKSVVDHSVKFPTVSANTSSESSTVDESTKNFPETLSTNSTLTNVTNFVGDVSSTISTLSEMVSEDSREKVLEFDSKEGKLSVSFSRNISKETEALYSYIRSLPPVPPILKKHFINLKQLAASSLEKLITSEEYPSEMESLFQEGRLRAATKSGVSLPQVKFDKDSLEIPDDEETSILFPLSEEYVSELMAKKGTFEVSSEMRTSKELSKAAKFQELKSKCNELTVWVTTDVTTFVTSTLHEFITETISKSIQLSITSFVTETKTKTSYQTILQNPETVTVTRTLGFTSEVYEPRKIQIVVTENPIHVLTNVHLKRFTQIYTDNSKIQVVDLITTSLVELIQFSTTTIVETQYQTSEIFALNTVTEFVTITILKPSPLFYTVTTEVHETSVLTVTETELKTKYASINSVLFLTQHLVSTTVVTVTQH